MRLATQILFIAALSLAVGGSRAGAAEQPREHPKTAGSTTSGGDCAATYNTLVLQAQKALQNGDRKKTIDLLVRAKQEMSRCPQLNDPDSEAPSELSLLTPR